MAVRQVSLALATALLLGCPRTTTSALEPKPSVKTGRELVRESGDSRVDPSRCVGDGLDLLTLVGAGPCTITASEASPLPDPELLVVEAPRKLEVQAGQRLEFELLLRNQSKQELVIDLAFQSFLPLAAVRTVRLGKGPGPDDACTLQAVSTEPPPERVTLPPRGELAIPCDWYANTRLVDPSSYVGSECPDFPPLPAGRYRSVFTIGGGAGTTRTMDVEIVVR
ncbi:hypothetical protein DB30_06099 [Enhygromyxa salina]|uniref:Lipoprotein n=1 Tax=Enhygromyxa salina TaxID=215803 RepID=A0A0C2D4R4_9BACT|nr:hypothetical protein [Enhygromyxa salina]KIG15067.1 hypothetical protein DB30_06099 [Enhygromyxa salina]